MSRVTVGALPLPTTCSLVSKFQAGPFFYLCWILEGSFKAQNCVMVLSPPPPPEAVTLLPYFILLPEPQQTPHIFLPA